MELGFFMKGFFLGVSIAAPVGPIGFLCISNTLRGGAKLGLACGLGAAAADALYAGIGAWGLTLLAERLTKYNSWLHFGGGVFLLYLGWRIFSSSPGRNRLGQNINSHWRTLAATFFFDADESVDHFFFFGGFCWQWSGYSRRISGSSGNSPWSILRIDLLVDFADGSGKVYAPWTRSERPKEPATWRRS